ncbi:LysR substrate-binding domain-containing protein [Pseudonocardia acaciae]|uniref:LysR substrate-binding domain-containing protein n=1 Tax=Pseudonocardia acaciae TaxID=551276 RepID=UPI0004910B70|nr:LysR substrate-binding domain-containing protein [Pseudonocardia acaciae]
MELRQLEYFVAVAEEASFTRAAARLHVAQPGVSAQVRQLERELAQPLLDRSGRSVRLTEVGAAAMPYARAALAAVADLRHAVEEHTGLLRGRVSVGMLASSSSGYDLARLLAGFHDRHPAVEMTLSEASSDQLVEALGAGRMDAAVIAPGVTAPTGLETLTVADEPLAAAVGHRDALADRDTITLAELRDRPLVSFPHSVGTRALIDDACASAGFRPRIAFEASDPNVLAELAASGLGVAILPAPYAQARPADLRTITITRPDLRGQLALAWRADAPLSPAARALIDHIRRARAS